MDAGYIRLHRKLLDNPVVCKDSDHIAVWVYVLLSATWKGYDIMHEGEKITLQPGQFVTGRKVISEKTKISESKVQRVLKLFENEHLIEQQTTPRNRLISVVNWNEYQNSEQQNEQQVNNKRTTSEQQVNTNNKVNKDNKDKNDNNSPFVEMDLINNTGHMETHMTKKNINEHFESLWNLYPRKQGKSSISDTNKRNLSKISVEEMTRAIERMKKGTSDPKYYPHGGTFYKTKYKDYLDDSYEGDYVSEEQEMEEHRRHKEREKEKLKALPPFDFQKQKKNSQLILDIFRKGSGIDDLAEG